MIRPFQGDLVMTKKYTLSCAALLFGALVSVSGCSDSGLSLNNTQTGALTGGALGAGLGAIVGNQSGHPGAGVAIGAAAGAIGGGLIGAQGDRTKARTDEQDERLRRQERELERQRREIEELRRGKSSDTGSSKNQGDDFRQKY